MNHEELTHRSLCSFLSAEYPQAVFTTDLSGVRLPIGLAQKVKSLKSSRGIPDLIIFHPSGRFNGLLIEIKREGAKLFLKNGNLIRDPHVEEQAEVITELRRRGYAAFFVCGFAAGSDLINAYFRHTHRMEAAATVIPVDDMITYLEWKPLATTV
jgi:hypothetical protein